MAKSLLLTALLAAVASAAPGLFDRAACNADNCLRAVRGTAVRPVSAGASACSSYFAQTFTPCGLPTTTTTVTVTSTSPLSYVPPTGTTAVADKRAAEITSASAICGGDGISTTVAPTYAPLPSTVASACSASGASAASSRYRSACSCAGITSYPVTTLSTVTSTATTTTTVRAPVPSNCKTFVVQATSGRRAGQYFVRENYLFLVPGAANATKWKLTGSNGYVVQAGATGANAALAWAAYPEYSGVDFKDPSTLPSGDDGQFDDEDEHSIRCAGLPMVNGSYYGSLTCQMWLGFGYGQMVPQTCTLDYGDGGEVVVDGIVDTSIDYTCEAIDAIVIPAC